MRMRKTKRIFCLLTLCAFVSFGLGGCGAAKSADDPTTINVGVNGAPQTIDPQVVSDTGSGEVVAYFTSTLYQYDPNRELVPAMAESSEFSEDGLTVTYHLKEGLKWSDGVSVTADDFVFGFQRLADPATKSGSIYLITDCCKIKNADEITVGEVPVSELGVSAPDNMTFVVELEQPCPYINSLFTLRPMSPCRRDFFNSCGGNYATSPETVLSCGPYILERYEPLASQIHFRKNPDYFDADIIEPENVSLQVVSDSQQAMMCYKANELDIVRTSGELAELAVGDTHLNSINTAQVYKLEINHQTNPALKNTDIRMALAKSIDRDSIAANVMRLGYYSMTRVIPPNFCFDSDGKDFAGDTSQYDEYMKFDAEKAKELWTKGLSETGLSGAKLEFICSSSQTKIVEALKAQMEKALPGLELEILPLPDKEWLNRVNSGRDYDLVLSSWVADYADPTALFQSCIAAPGTIKYSGEKFQELYKNSYNASGAERDSMLHEAEEILMKDVALIPLFGGQSNYLISEGVSGYQMNPTGVEPIVTGLRKEMR